MVDLKLVYQAVTEEEALENLRLFKEKWGKVYPCRNSYFTRYYSAFIAYTNNRRAAFSFLSGIFSLNLFAVRNIIDLGKLAHIYSLVKLNVRLD